MSIMEYSKELSSKVMLKEVFLFAHSSEVPGEYGGFPVDLAMMYYIQDLKRELIKLKGENDGNSSAK